MPAADNAQKHLKNFESRLAAMKVGALDTKDKYFVASLDEEPSNCGNSPCLTYRQEEEEEDEV